MIKKESLVKKAAYLRIASADLAEGMKSGNFRSLYKGQGIEFSGVRDYIRGDDVRSIDWNVTARMGRPYVKVFEEERELQIFIIVDNSFSMQLANDSYTKYEASAEAAALLTIAAELNGCPVGAVFFDGAIYFSCAPKLGREQTMLILNHLDKGPKENIKGSVLESALKVTGKLLRKRSLVFIFSDFRSSHWEDSLISLAQKNDVVAFRMWNSFDEQLPQIGYAPFTDCESDLVMHLPTTSSQLKKEWRLQNESNTKQWQTLCLKHGVVPIVFKTTDEPFQVLNAVFDRKRFAK